MENTADIMDNPDDIMENCSLVALNSSSNATIFLPEWVGSEIIINTYVEIGLSQVNYYLLNL